MMKVHITAIVGFVLYRTPTLSVEVDYRIDFKTMVRAGKYDFVSSDITEENYRIRGNGAHTVLIKLVTFDGRWMTTDDVLAELDRRNLRPARIEELLAFGAKYPQLMYNYPIVALGSYAVFNDTRFVPFLWTPAATIRNEPFVVSGSEDPWASMQPAIRYLLTRATYDPWKPHWRFLAVAKGH